MSLSAPVCVWSKIILWRLPWTNKQSSRAGAGIIVKRQLADSLDTVQSWLSLSLRLWNYAALSFFSSGPCTAIFQPLDTPFVWTQALKLIKFVACQWKRHSIKQTRPGERVWKKWKAAIEIVHTKVPNQNKWMRRANRIELKRLPTMCHVVFKSSQTYKRWLYTHTHLKDTHTHTHTRTHTYSAIYWWKRCVGDKCRGEQRLRLRLRLEAWLCGPWKWKTVCRCTVHTVHTIKGRTIQLWRGNGRVQAAVQLKWY